VSDRPLAGFGIVVAGGSRGIGAAVSAKLAECGAGVVVNGRDVGAVECTVAAIIEAGGRAVAHAGSAAGESVADDLIALCENRFGAVRHPRHQGFAAERSLHVAQRQGSSRLYPRETNSRLIPRTTREDAARRDPMAMSECPETSDATNGMSADRSVERSTSM